LEKRGKEEEELKSKANGKYWRIKCLHFHKSKFPFPFEVEFIVD